VRLLATELARNMKASEATRLLCDAALWQFQSEALADVADVSVADLTNSPSYGLAGAITAALFLNRFVEKAKSWLHLDIPGWVDRPKPGRRVGGEANAARALYALLKARYGR